MKRELLAVYFCCSTCSLYSYSWCGLGDLGYGFRLSGVYEMFCTTFVSRFSIFIFFYCSLSCQLNFLSIQFHLNKTQLNLKKNGIYESHLAKKNWKKCVCALRAYTAHMNIIEYVSASWLAPSLLVLPSSGLKTVWSWSQTLATDLSEGAHSCQLYDVSSCCPPASPCVPGVAS